MAFASEFLPESAVIIIFMSLSGLNVEMRRSSNTSWVLANLNVTGYYRVNYDPENWERLLGQLGSDPQVKRVGLLLVSLAGHVFSSKMAPSFGCADCPPAEQSPAAGRRLQLGSVTPSAALFSALMPLGSI